MAKNEAAPVEHESRFFDRCVELIDPPAWMDALIRVVPALQRSSEGGDREVTIIVTDPDGDLKLCGYIIAGGGQHVYAVQSDVAIQEEMGFWTFAATNYIWVTPTIGLRKAVAAQVGGKAEGQSFKLASEAMPVDTFIASITAPQPVQEKPVKKRKKSAEAAPEPIGSPELPMSPEVGATAVDLSLTEEASPTAEATNPSVPEVEVAQIQSQPVVELAVGQTMSLF